MAPAQIDGRHERDRLHPRAAYRCIDKIDMAAW